MQEIPGIGGGRELIGDVAGDWTVKQSQHNLNRQLLKCPRCDSINTKFCYYNNYNLSQPRHFCKNCRRYWTKGGILRSVPVGSGCRKTKRSKPKHSSEVPASVITKPNSDYHSNGDCKSSSLTAIAVAMAAETVSDSTLTSLPNRTMPPECYPFSSQAHNSPLSPELMGKSSDGELFSYNRSFWEGFPIGCSNFSGITPPPLLSPQCPHRDQSEGQNNIWNTQSFIEIGDEEEPGLPEIGAGFLDQTMEVDLPPLQSRPNMEFGSFNHLEMGRLDLIDIPGAVDGNYWNDLLEAHSNYPFSIN